MAFFVEDLLTSAKMRSFAPMSQSTFQDSDLITIAYEELCLKLVSDIMSVREDFFLTTKTTAIVANVDHYPLPKYAIGNALKVLIYQDSGGSEMVLQHIDVEDRVKFAGSSASPTNFYFEGDEVVLCPKPSTSTGNLIFSYFKKPNILAATTSCTKITAISTVAGTTTFTVNTDLTATLSVGSYIDILSAQSPYLLWYFTVPITAITTTTIAVATTGVTNAASTVEAVVNDYICPNGYANIPQVPDEFYPVLCQMTAVRMLAGLGDIQKWTTAKQELAEMRKEALKLIKNRAEVSPKRVRGNGFVKAFRF